MLDERCGQLSRGFCWCVQICRFSGPPCGLVERKRCRGISLPAHTVLRFLCPYFLYLQPRAGPYPSNGRTQSRPRLLHSVCHSCTMPAFTEEYSVPPSRPTMVLEERVLLIGKKRERSREHRRGYPSRREFCLVLKPVKIANSFPEDSNGSLLKDAGG